MFNFKLQSILSNYNELMILNLSFRKYMTIILLQRNSEKDKIIKYLIYRNDDGVES